ncbi:TolC family outer membrane protein [bacterium]|nr:TolC family outer membrane protein [bacterium]
MKKYLMIFVGGILMLQPAQADMYRALGAVYDANPVIGQQRAAVHAAMANLDLARTGYKPYLGVGANAGLARTRVMGHDYNTVPTQFGVEFQQNVFQGFATVARVKAAKGMLASQQALLYATQQDVFLSAINAYVNVLNATEVLKLNTNNQRVLAEYYDFVAAQKSVGNLTKSDVSAAMARLESAKYHVIEARAQYDNALETFRRIYGDVADEYGDVDVTPMRDIFPDNIDDAQTVALRDHPALVALTAQESAAREDIVVARQTRMPSVDIRASAMQMDDIPVLDRVRDGRVGIYFSMPIYDRGTASANMDRVQFTVDGIGQKIVDARRAVVENLRQAWNLYDAQTAAITAATARIRASQMAVDGISAEQRAGRRTVLDVLNARQDLLDARVSLARARHSQTSAFFAVLAAMGRLTPENLGLGTND